MDYEKTVKNKIDIINSVFESINVPELLSNQDFIVDNNFHFEHCVKFILRKPNAINLELVLISDALQINIDRTMETFEWSNSQISKDIIDVKNLIKILFTSRIKVEYCGSNYTKLYFIDKYDNYLKTLKYIKGLYFKIGCEIKEYEPIYSSNR
ncbi:MAG: hypothetical protein POELPBGB_02948 [Bacteroidia bacterium]|nr:hypothetical protein [Bacteroidia bacterium]